MLTLSSQFSQDIFSTELHFFFYCIQSRMWASKLAEMFASKLKYYISEKLGLERIIRSINLGQVGQPGYPSAKYEKVKIFLFLHTTGLIICS